MKKDQGNWTVERHGGGRKHGWRKAFAGNEKPARNQLNLHRHHMSQGGVLLRNTAGVVLEGWWRRHAPDAVPLRIRFCIGCGCDDFHACADPITEEGCYWMFTDKRTATGICSCCGSAMKRWKAGDRIVSARS